MNFFSVPATKVPNVAKCLLIIIIHTMVLTWTSEKMQMVSEHYVPVVPEKTDEAFLLLRIGFY